jgi:hypothetical protein
MPAIIPDIPTVETEIVQMTNDFRSKNKLGDVRPNKELSDAARAYAAYLAKTGSFSHTADGREAGDRVTSAGYEWCQIGENLALAQDSRGFEARPLAKKAVEGWINSPTHRKNMLAPYATEIGVGVARAPDKDPKFISVQLFARPRSLQYEFQISNSSREAVGYSFGGEEHEVGPSYAVTHTACAPSPLAFDRIGDKPVAIRYEATGGIVYTLKPDRKAGLKVEIGPLERAE